MRPALSPSARAGGRGSVRVHRRVLRAAPALLVTALTVGCATKGDVRDVRTDLASLQVRQDSIYQLLQMQNRQIMDSLLVTTERLLNVRGELANQLRQLQEQLEQVGHLTGQVQVRLNQLDQQLSQAVRSISETGLTPGADPGGARDPNTFSEPEQYYEIGVEQMNRGNAETARRAFQMVVDGHSTHRLAPDAQRQIGETYALEAKPDSALRAFDRVVERWQDSDAAPMALYRAGVISQERGNIARARQYFRRVISGYPNSDARRLAEEALRRLPG